MCVDKGEADVVHSPVDAWRRIAGHLAGNGDAAQVAVRQRLAVALVGLLFRLQNKLRPTVQRALFVVAFWGAVRRISSLSVSISKLVEAIC